MGPVSVKLTGDLYMSVCQDEPMLKAHVATIRLADVGKEETAAVQPDWPASCACAAAHVCCAAYMPAVRVDLTTPVNCLCCRPGAAGYDQRAALLSEAAACVRLSGQYYRLHSAQAGRLAVGGPAPSRVCARA